MTTSIGTPSSVVTIHDVARVAGVATSTVSRALSDPGRVRASTRERVIQAATELGYVPSSQAKALRSGRTKNIALVVPDISNPFLIQIIRGSQHQLKAAGYLQVLVDTEESTEVEWDTLQKLRHAVDGIVLTASRLSDDQLVEMSQLVPLVVINRIAPGIASTVIDTQTGFEASVEHLVSLGHSKLLYVSGPVTSWSNGVRLAAVRAACERLGVELAVTRSFRPTLESGASAADAALNSGASACIAYNDLLAIGMLRRFAERGVSVPDDMSVVGCDDIFGADFCTPALTTLGAPIEQAGRSAVSMLLSQLDDDASPRRETITIPTHLIVRKSSGPYFGGANRD